MDPTFLWIAGSGLVMSAIALVGSVTALVPERALRRLLSPLVALAAGSLIGGALFHLLPTSVELLGNGALVYALVAVGFTAFFVLEQFVHWHHCHQPPADHRAPVGYLVLAADAVHNFVGGVAVAGAFVADVRVGISAWLAAAAHEVPQELGDFGVLIHSGWRRRRAIVFNVLSALTFVVGGLAAYALSFAWNVSFLLPLAAGNFLYIGAADLVPEVARTERIGAALVHLAAFAGGLAILLLARIAFAH